MFSGSKLREIRKSRCYTLRRLGEKAGISWMAIRYYEIGLRKPGADALKALATALDVKIEDFFE